jgi:hypothetical protein
METAFEGLCGISASPEMERVKRRHSEGELLGFRPYWWVVPWTSDMSLWLIAIAKDVWAAFISGKATLIPTESWVDDMSIGSVLAKGDLDDYCNLAHLIFAKIVNVLATFQNYGRTTRAAMLEAPLCGLWDAMQEWYRLRPADVCPVLRDFPPSRVFPDVLHARSSPSKTFLAGQLNRC